MRLTRALAAVAVGLTASFAAPQPADALPGFFVSKKSTAGKANASHVAIVKKGEQSVVSVMPDYEGGLDPFALVMPVPADVTLDKVKTLRREFIDRLEMLTAPRFMEFWEMDPCDPGPLEQEWERSKMAAGGAGFLGGMDMGSGPQKKVPPEMLVDVKSEYKEGEYTFSLLDKDKAGDLEGFLKVKGYQLPDAAKTAVKPYVDAGMGLLVAEVDTKRIELVGGERAVLSPIRYETASAVTKIPVKLGLVNLDKKQELFLYVLDQDTRYEVKNYGNTFPPTNIPVSFDIKERMGEFYTAIHDLIQKKDPKTFLVEFAWPTEGCGQPCQNEPLLVSELLSLGGDVLEAALPEEEQNPKPPELTEEEKKKQEAELKAIEAKDRAKAKKDMEADRKELFRRKGIIARQKYILTRLHHRYDASNLPEDPVIGPAAAITGGQTIPKGQKKEISFEVKPGPKNQMQTRYNNFHEWKGMMKCDRPERWRWGKPPREYRGLRKTWVAADLTRKSRTQIDPAKMVLAPIPSIGLAGVVEGSDAGADGGTEVAPPPKKGCGCRVAGEPEGGNVAALSLSAIGLALLVKRRWRSKSKS
jgi:MYXO-CTERM domain-containing protein